MIKPGAYRGFELTIEDPGIAIITFNQPERLNGMTFKLKRDLLEVITQCQMEDAVRVVVFTGSGEAFSAGDDISGKPLPEEKEGLVPEIFHGHHNAIGTYNGLRWISQPINWAIRKLDKLTIAAINGVAIQTGFSLALSCDFRIAARGARMGSATLRFGLMPDEGGQYLLVQLMGVAKTMDFLMRKKIVSADQALDLGLVGSVVEPDQLMPEALGLAKELAEGPQVAMRLLKQSIYNAAEIGFAQAMDEIASKTPMCDHHPDAQEGVKAFQEKREAKFNQWLEDKAS